MKVKSLGHFKGNLPLHFYAQNDLILKIEQKKIFSKKIFFSEKKIPGPAKMAVFGHISAKKFNFDMRFFLNGQI